MGHGTMQTALPFLHAIGLDLLLSVDNAVLFAIGLRGLPEAQRGLGLALATLGVVAARIVLSGTGALLMAMFPWWRPLAAFALLWVATQLVIQHDRPLPRVHIGGNLFTAVVGIILASSAANLDSAIAVAGVAAVAGEPDVLWAFVLSVPLVAFGHQAIMALLHRLPLLFTLGGISLGWTAVCLASDLLASHEAWAAGLILAWTLLSVGIYTYTKRGFHNGSDPDA